LQLLVHELEVDLVFLTDSMQDLLPLLGLIPGRLFLNQGAPLSDPDSLPFVRRDREESDHPHPHHPLEKWIGEEDDDENSDDSERRGMD
jgi:hypothetical protein